MALRWCAVAFAVSGATQIRLAAYVGMISLGHTAARNKSKPVLMACIQVYFMGCPLRRQLDIIAFLDECDMIFWNGHANGKGHLIGADNLPGARRE